MKNILLVFSFLSVAITTDYFYSSLMTDKLTEPGEPTITLNHDISPKSSEKIAALEEDTTKNIKQTVLNNTSKFSVVVKKNRLSINVQDGSLEMILKEISEQSGILIVSDIGNQSVTLRLDNETIDIGLLKLLTGYDVFMLYGTEKTNQLLKKAWVYRPGEGQVIVPVPPGEWASTQEIKKDLNNSNPNTRAYAVEVLIDREGQSALDSVLSNLRDDNDQVRYRTLYKAVAAGLVLPANSLWELLQYDPSHDVRLLALEAIDGQAIDEQSKTSAAKLALNDNNLYLQFKAKQILSRFAPSVDETLLKDDYQPLHKTQEMID